MVDPGRDQPIRIVVEIHVIYCGYNFILKSLSSILFLSCIFNPFGRGGGVRPYKNDGAIRRTLWGLNCGFGTSKGVFKVAQNSFQHLYLDRSL